MPAIDVDGVGRIAFPVLPVQAERLVAIAEVAPFGRGEETVVDREVRRTLAQIGAALIDALPGDPTKREKVDAWTRPTPVKPGFVVDLLTAASRIDVGLAARAMTWSMYRCTVTVVCGRSLSPAAPKRGLRDLHRSRLKPCDEPGFQTHIQQKL